ncbi:uncharacterized protein LOC123537218 [Mercenaria mercenaria]|uniref:uncharacterized protein LOC123537218 n=1 Tax=Mercenaria mercenaria TaxID=6596 RepID=UPI00234ED214|nr:uncharacterized protein LOC123537218 [Mercenaria mercenaria]
MEDSDLINEETMQTGGSQPNSRASSRKPEFVFEQSPSALSSEETETVEPLRPESTVEYLMTAQEIKELDERLEVVIGRLQKQREDYETWENSLNRRRLEAYGRLKALGKFHRQRMEVYDTVKDYLQTMNPGSKSRTSKK